MQLTKSKKQIVDILNNRPLENTEAIKNLENMLYKNRGSVFIIPKPNTPVIVLLSGGMDSVATTFLLLKMYKLHIYPLFIKRSQQRSKRELSSATHYVAEMQKRYGHLCENLEIIDAPIPPKKIRRPLALFSNTPYNKFRQSKQLRGLPVYLLSLVAVSVQYASYLEITRKIKVRTIFCGFVASDGTVMAYETLTALRSAMVSICLLQNDFSWQFTSMALEKEVGFFLEKFEILQWCNQENISLKKTWSCYFPFKLHCGECMGCVVRKSHFSQARIADETIYRKPNRLERKIYKLWLYLHEKAHQFHF